MTETLLKKKMFQIHAKAGVAVSLDVVQLLGKKMTAISVTFSQRIM